MPLGFWLTEEQFRKNKPLLPNKLRWVPRIDDWKRWDCLHSPAQKIEKSISTIAKMHDQNCVVWLYKTTP